MQVSAAALISAEAEPWTNAESAAYSSLPAVTLVQTRGNCWVKLLSFHHGVPSSRLLPLTCLSLCHCLEKDFPSLPRSEKSMVRKARSASQLDSGMAMVPPKPCELGCIFGIFVWVWYFHAFLFWEKADTVSMCMCELFFPTACWHNVSENLPFSYYFIYLCLIRLKKRIDVPGSSGTCECLDIQYMHYMAWMDRAYCLCAVFFLKLCGFRKHSCFIPSSGKDISHQWM